MSKSRFLVLGVLLAASIVLWFFNNGKSGSNGFSCEWNERFDPGKLEYVNHALCRMKCRAIDQELVEEVYEEGTVNCRKSGITKGAQRYALEKEDSNGDRIRIIVEDEGEKHLIITVIRLGKDDLCECA